MSEPMTRAELVAHLRDLADLYETMGVDKLPRDLMRNSADTIDRLTSELEAAKTDLHMLSELHKFCDTCKHNKGQGVWDCGKYECDKKNLYEWRGTCAANSPEPGGEESK